MSRIAKKPVAIPQGVEVRVEGREVHAKGPRGAGSVSVHQSVGFERHDDRIEFTTADAAMSGTMRALVANLMTGVSRGFERRLELAGVGFRGRVKGDILNLQIGYSHPVDYRIDEAVVVETPSATEIVVKGVDKQKVGQVAAEIRGLRPPEPYKGKGVCYSGERIRRKDAKKK